MWAIWTVGYKENVDPNPSSHSRSSQTPGLPWFTQGRRHGLGRTAIILWDTLLPISYCSYCVDVQSLPLALSHLFKGKETLLLLTFVTMSSTVLDKLVRILTRDSSWFDPCLSSQSHSSSCSRTHTELQPGYLICSAWGTVISLMSKSLQNSPQKWPF